MSRRSAYRVVNSFAPGEPPASLWSGDLEPQGDVLDEIAAKVVGRIAITGHDSMLQRHTDTLSIQRRRILGWTTMYTANIYNRTESLDPLQTP